MKLSEIKQEFDRATYGEWLQWGSRRLFVRVRGFLVPEYQRALRAVYSSFSPLPEDAPIADRLERDELIGKAMLPYLCKHVLVGWWGLDAEGDPVPEGEMEEGRTTEVVAVVNGHTLRTVRVGAREFRDVHDDGREARPIEGLFQEMVPYAPESAAEQLADPRCGELLNAIRTAAGILDTRLLKAEAEALGKPATTSAGKSTTATTPKR